MGGFLAVGHDGLRLFSPDGRDWSAPPATGREGEVYRAAAFGGGRFAAVGTFGGDNIHAASADGRSWKTGKKEARYVDYFQGLFHLGGRFVALGGDAVTVGDGKPFLATSADGETWGDYRRIAGRFILRRLAFGGGVYVGVGDRGRRAWSADGAAWQDDPAAKPVDTLVDVAYGNGVFVGSGLHGLRMASADGKVWGAPQRGQEGEHVNTMLFAGWRFVGVGAGATYVSKDGAAWERTPNRDAPLTAVYGNGLFVGAAWKGRILVSEDAVTWRQVHRAAQHVEALAFGAG